MAWTREFPLQIRKRAGDTIWFEIEMLTDRSGEAVSSLTGWTFRFTLKSDPDSADDEKLAGSKDSTDEGIQLVSRFARWKLTGSETAALPLRTDIYFDVQATDRFGESRTLRAGRLYLDRQVTRTAP